MGATTLRRNESTSTGKDMWKAVDSASSKAPEWIKKRMENSSTTSSTNNTKTK